MNMLVKYVLLVLFLCLTACTDTNNNNDSDLKSAIITGPDYRKCMCCGGWFIEIDNVQYNISTIPDDSQINLEKETFPLAVLVSFNKRTTGCENIIDIIKIKKK